MNKCKMIKRWILVCKDGREIVFSNQTDFDKARKLEYPKKK